MSRRTTLVPLLLLVLGLQLPAVAAAQASPETRAGFWWNGGLGYSTIGCDGCTRRQNSLAIAMAAGGTVSRKVLFGASIDAATRSESGARQIVATVLARLRFYPSLTSGFFLTAGVGLGMLSAEGTDANRRDTGTAALLGLGYDIRVGPNVSLTPFWNGFSTGELDTNYNVGQLGLSLTIH